MSATRKRIKRRLQALENAGRHVAQPGNWNGFTIDQRAMLATVLAEEFARVEEIATLERCVCVNAGRRTSVVRVEDWRNYVTDDEIKEKAVAWAREKHKGQFRKSTVGPVEYIEHPLEVALILMDHGVIDNDIIVAGVLHDIVEDTPVTVVDVALKFNDVVADYVEECTTDFPGMTVKQKRALLMKKCPTWSYGARCIKVADGLSNLRSIVNLAPDWHVHTQRGYTDTTCMVVMEIEKSGPQPPESLIKAFYVQSILTYEEIEGREELRKIRKQEEKLARKLRD